MALPRLYTTNEVHEALGVSRKTIRRMIDSGELPALKIGTVWRFREDDILAVVGRDAVGPLRAVKDIA